MDGTKPSRLEERCLDLVNKLRSELGPQPYSSVDLRSYTSNLSNNIGFGGYGEVYKGYLPDGVPVAVKVLKNNDVMDETFLVEVRILGMASHRHVVKFYGYCFEDNMKALVFEYMENGSLDKILYENHHPSIEWVMLYGIAIEIANGLRYLHADMDRQIIHHDIKAGNVLLDKNFSAKIIDFGLAKSINRDVSRVTLSRERGTFGYNAPETWMPNSQVTSRCDVYSFGMMLFEILGKRNNGLEKNWFPGIVWNQFKSGKLQQLIEEYGIKETDNEKAIRLSKVALWCVQFTAELRPSMEDVVLMLQDKKLIEDPPYPSFLGWQDSTSQVVSEDCRADNERERSDSPERGNPMYPQNIIDDQRNSPIAGGYGGDSLLPQPREEDKCKKFRTTKLVGKTALNYSEMMLKWILKDEAVTFCINGMGGVGKTTIMDDVYNQLIAEDLERHRKYFDQIIWVSISKDENFIKLVQEDLAEELEIELPRGNNVLKRSRVLFQALEKMKKVVLFLDDVWKYISLDEIGIPQPTLENGCKLLFTTRKLDMSRRMRCDKTITVEPLPEDEAWDLFMKKVNYVLTPEVRKVAEMVAKKCSGLPLAIITVGKAMSDENYSDIEYWTGALNELNLKDPSNETMDMEMENVYKCLKFSYDRLRNDKLRECFLCCALYPESWKIIKRNLQEFWIMDGIVVGINRQNELFQGRHILDNLKDQCLLETIDKIYDREYFEISDGVKMHDLIRGMALRLKSNCFMVKDGPSLRELPDQEEWVDLEKASFMHNEIEELSISPICPNLSTLILEGTSLKSVSHEFFVHMKSLKVLDLRCERNDKLTLLPDSISDLVNLRVLRLSWYKKLKKLPSLAKLVSLRMLELNNTGIEELPEGMERLVKFTCLNLHWVHLKERIPFGLISKLSALQELYLGGIEVDKLYEVGKGESFAEELLSLKKLENLSVSFRLLSDYASYVGSPKFKGLTFFYLVTGAILYSGPFYLGRPPHATVRICYPAAHKQTALCFPQNTKRVEFESFANVIRLNELRWLIKDVKELIAFTIKECNKLECIWSSKENEEKFSATVTSSICWLQSLENINIHSCTKLYTIFEGISISSGVFCLKELTIDNCNNLKNVFPSSRLLRLFPKLERIVVAVCGEIEELIGDDEENTNTETPIVIPCLKLLIICDLPKLKRIYRGVMICYSLEYVLVTNCLELKRLPRLQGKDHSTPPSALSEIKGSREWWNSLEWDPDYPQNILQPFFCIEEESYHSDLEQSSQLVVNVHNQCVCDNCEMDPIVGKLYKCKTCYDEISGGFDLCEKCYNTPSKHTDLVNQHQRKGHTFALIADGGTKYFISPLDEMQLQYAINMSLMLEGEKSSQSDECALNLELASSSQHTYNNTEFGEAHVTMDPYGETEEMQLQYAINLSLMLEGEKSSESEECAPELVGHLNSHPDGEDSLMLEGEKSSQSNECAPNLELALSPQHTYSNTEFGEAHVTMDPYGETEKMQLQYAINLSLGVHPCQAHNYALLQSPLPNEILKQKETGKNQMQKTKPLTKIPKGPAPNKQVLKPMGGLGEGKSCCLALGVKSNIVAKGKVFEECGLEHKLHTVALGVNNLHVSIDEVICDDALLPIPFGDEFVTVRNAHKSHVAWPKEFVIKDIEVSSQKTVEGFNCKEKYFNQSKTGESSSSELQGSIDSFKEALQFMLPNENDHVRFPLGKDFLGGDNGDEFSYLPKSDIIDACNVETLEVINIIAYMRFLYEKFESIRDVVLFVNPVTFSRAEDKDKSKVLLKRLQETKGKRFVFIPFNPGNHWILIAIDLVCMNVFWLDSLHGEPDRDLKISVNTALMLFKSVEENKVVSPTWHSSKVPKQPNYKECGFYCMKFMRELMEESSQSMEIRVKNLVAKKKYSKNDIDELRVEFIEFIQNCMGAYSQE